MNSQWLGRAGLGSAFGSACRLEGTVAEPLVAAFGQRCFACYPGEDIESVSAADTTQQPALSGLDDLAPGPSKETFMSSFQYYEPESR